MTLHLHGHPLSSYCQKALIALYENETPFVFENVDLGDPAGRAAHRELWPMGKMPVLRDDALDRTVPESSIVIEYLSIHHPGKVALVPADADRARQVRLRDRFFDCYVMTPMQKLVDDKLRPADKRDPYGVEEARKTLRLAYATIEADLGSKTWTMGDDFTMADCSAAPSLFFARYFEPLTDHPKLAAYFDRLLARPSIARVVAEGAPFMKFFPGL